MKIKSALLDTNIIIHRESSKVINEDIGLLFRWLDQLKITKSIHGVTVKEIQKYADEETVKAFEVKILSYNILKTNADIHKDVKDNFESTDVSENDVNDSILLNELYIGRHDILISEDRGIHRKAEILGVQERVFTIDAFIELCISDNPELADYKVLAVKKELFGNINVDESFFNSFREDYPGFDDWFQKKNNEFAYTCRVDDKLLASLYVKVEKEDENYSDITPHFAPKRRLKIGTFKVELNGFRLGERFMKIVFDNALRSKVNEIYVTIFDKSLEQERLISLFEDYGFYLHGLKKSNAGEEKVYVRDFSKKFDLNNPKISFPYISLSTNIFITPIWPDYHTDLLPDSILKTESPEDFTENEPFRNAISKVYISRSVNRNLEKGDIIIFYRTGGYYKGVITTIGIVEGIHDKIVSEDKFIELCGKRSVFSTKELSEWWNHKPRYRPFIVNFLYAYSFPKRLNLKWLIDADIIKDTDNVPRGFEQINKDKFELIIKDTMTDESIIVN